MAEMKRQMVEDLMKAVYSKTEYDLIFQKAEEDQELFNLLWSMVKENTMKRSWRLLWMMDHASEKKNDFILPLLDEFYRMVIDTNNESFIRHGMRLILRCPINEDYAASMLDRCICWMNNPKAKISTQVYGLEFFYRTCELYPKMAPELLAYIDNILSRNPSAGYRVRLRRVRKVLGS